MSITRALFTAGVNLNAWLTRKPALQWLEGKVLTPFFVKLTYWVRGRRPVATTAGGLGREWERVLGFPEVASITSVEGETAYGEIRAHCPLRGTGDVEACHRMMAFDRGLLRQNGARLVVLQSQAEPGRTTCRVAIRAMDVDATDLVPAHVRLSRATESRTPS